MNVPAILGELPPYREAMARGDWESACALLCETAGGGGAGALPPHDVLQLSALLSVRGRRGEADPLLEELGKDCDRSIAAEALVQLALLRLSNQTVPSPEVEGTIDRASALAAGNARLQGLAAHARSRLHWQRAEMPEAGACLEEARRRLEEAGAEEDLAKVLDSLAMYHEHCGEGEKALSCYSLSLAKKAVWRDLYGIGLTLGNLGRFHLKHGDPRMALSFLQDDLRITRSTGDELGQVVVKTNIGQALTDLGRLDEAEREIEVALAQARAGGFRKQEVFALKDLGRAAARKGEWERAHALLEAALGLLAAEPPSYIRGQVLLVRGELLLDRGDAAGARRSFEDALACFAPLDARDDQALAYHGLAKAAEGLGERNSCFFYIERGMGLLGSLFSPLRPRFEEILSRLEDTTRFLLLPRTIGPYRVLARIGSGAHKEVYRAFDGREGAARHDVAVKVLRLESAKDEREREALRARFRRECEILSCMNHPNVVRLVDAGEDGLPYFVEEYIEGGDLSDLIGGPRPVELESALGILRGVLRGLDALHAQGIVHRDLKPANVLLREGTEAVLTDFGISRVLHQGALTLRSAIIGTLGYMAPEQLRGDRGDVRADLFAAGVILFELLTGRLPYGERSPRLLLRSMEGGAPLPAIGTLRPGLPRGLERCLARSLARQKQDRYASAAEFLRELEAAGTE